MPIMDENTLRQPLAHRRSTTNLPRPRPSSVLGVSSIRGLSIFEDHPDMSISSSGYSSLNKSLDPVKNVKPVADEKKAGKSEAVKMRELERLVKGLVGDVKGLKGKHNGLNERLTKLENLSVPIVPPASSSDVPSSELSQRDLNMDMSCLPRTPNKRSTSPLDTHCGGTPDPNYACNSAHPNASVITERPSALTRTPAHNFSFAEPTQSPPVPAVRKRMSMGVMPGWEGVWGEVLPRSKVGTDPGLAQRKQPKSPQAEKKGAELDDREEQEEVLLDAVRGEDKLSTDEEILHGIDTASISARRDSVKGTSKDEAPSGVSTEKTTDPGLVMFPWHVFQLEQQGEQIAALTLRLTALESTKSIAVNAKSEPKPHEEAAFAGRYLQELARRERAEQELQSLRGQVVQLEMELEKARQARIDEWKDADEVDESV